MNASHRKTRLLTSSLSACLLAVMTVALGSTAHAAAYPESNYGGDFSNDSSAPTALGTFATGNNVVSGTTGNGDNDYFTFTVAPGTELAAIRLLSSAVPPDRTFIGIAAGATVPAITTFMTDGNFTTAAGLLGWYLINADLDGQDILQDLGASDPPNFPTFTGETGFSGPLPAGTYSMWVLDGDGPVGTPYTLDYEVSGIPEPSAWVMMIAGAGLIGGTLRRRQKLAAATA